MAIPDIKPTFEDFSSNLHRFYSEVMNLTDEVSYLVHNPGSPERKHNLWKMSIRIEKLDGMIRKLLEYE
jgi:hypothetical protein